MGDEKKEPKQIIYASSISVYGEKINLDIYDENIKESPTTPYGITKLESEKFFVEKISKKIMDPQICISLFPRFFIKY